MGTARATAVVFSLLNEHCGAVYLHYSLRYDSELFPAKSTTLIVILLLVWTAALAWRARVLLPIRISQFARVLSCLFATRYDRLGLFTGA